LKKLVEIDQQLRVSFNVHHIPGDQRHPHAVVRGGQIGRNPVSREVEEKPFNDLAILIEMIDGLNDFPAMRAALCVRSLWRSKQIYIRGGNQVQVDQGLPEPQGIAHGTGQWLRLVVVDADHHRSRVHKGDHKYTGNRKLNARYETRYEMKLSWAFAPLRIALVCATISASFACERTYFVWSEPGMRDAGFLTVLRRVAVISVLAGAAGSVALMLHAGRRQQSRVLVLLFTIWVVSPFIATLIANSVLKRWPVGARATLHVLMVVLTLGSLVIYGEVAFEYVKAKAGFVFLVVPFGSWLLIAVVIATAAIISARQSRRIPG
jgi:hypothetical protein